MSTGETPDFFLQKSEEKLFCFRCAYEYCILIAMIFISPKIMLVSRLPRFLSGHFFGNVDALNIFTTVNFHK